MRKKREDPYRIGHVIYDSPGGSGNVVFKLLDNVKSDYFIQEAILFGCLMENSTFYRKYLNRVIFNFVFKHRGFDFKFLISLMKLIKKKKYDLVFLHDSTASMYGRFVKIFSPKTKIISVYHGERPGNKLARIVDLITGTLLTNRIICVSEFVQRKLPKFLRRKSQVIYNGIEYEMFLKSKRIEEDLPVIISVCRLEYPKDLLTVVRACKKLFDGGLNFKFKIAGEGAQYKDIEKYIHDNNLFDRVELLGWQENVAYLLSQSDVFVLSSYSEGLPISILEAMSTGLPIIASNVGGIPEVVYPDVNGYLFEPGNEEDFARYLSLLLNKVELRRAMGQHSLELVRNFSFDKFINSWTDYILKTLHR